jgi:dTDP-4-amino-4,6-dideoxygalactose transaminase
MQDNGVGTDIMYPSPVHLQPCYHDYAGDSCPEAENFAKEVICLPIGAHISENSAAEIAQVVNLFNK